ncbi:PhzF family phenazine biosynthesis protein [Croceibacterium sp. TMG7-5b_MA50]|uniref:PhzF family phenazine biosynthesis protein n=1 Tax=Croceibacterium sp. TMG7-5b_MA50 TaxID=3121290 RepID=UPI003221A078
MTATAPYWHIDAFAARPFAGNQAAVIELAEWLPDSVLQQIAAENMFSETAFLLRDASEVADWELRWFTPEYEIRLCGHATLASGHALLGRDGGTRVTFRTRRAGMLEVRVDGDGYCVALPAIPVQRTDWPEGAGPLGTKPQEVWRHPAGYNVFLFAGEEEVRTLAPDMAGLARLGPDHQFICTAVGSATDVVSRVFVPGAGIPEDPVTGSAHAVLAGFWAPRLGRDSFTAHQASERGGDIACRLDGNRVWLTGQCVTIVEGQFRLP